MTIIATILLTPYVSQYGIVEVDGRMVSQFTTNPVLPHWINGGVYVVDRSFEDHLPEIGDHEDSTFPELAAAGRLGAFQLRGALARHGQRERSRQSRRRNWPNAPLNYAGAD